MEKYSKITIQEASKDNIDDIFIAALDIETEESPTEKLLHKQSRFLYIVSGKGKIKIQNNVHEMKKGKIIALLPWQLSEIIEVEEALTFYLLIYNFSFFNKIIKKHLNVDSREINIINDLYENNSIDIPENKRDYVAMLFSELRDEIGIRSLAHDSTKHPYSSVYLLSIVTQIIIFYIRHTKEIPEEKHNISVKIFRYMFLNSSEDLSLSKLSKIFLMSESSISKYINNMTGIGFYELLNEMKLSKAKYLLGYTNLTLDEIAKILNFTDSAQLSKLFSERFNIGTKKYRQLNLDVEALADIRLDYRSYKIIDYIYDNYCDDIDISDISKLFKMPARNINKILRYYVEQNFNSFLNKLRIYKSCELLINTDMTISDIAVSVGYNSSKTFTRNFSKLLDITPGNFRDLKNKGDNQ